MTNAQVALLAAAQVKTAIPKDAVLGLAEQFKGWLDNQDLRAERSARELDEARHAQEGLQE